MTVLKAIKVRRSVRAYSLRPIPDDLMQRMQDALRYAPSACNIQPWQFILVTDATLRRQLARAAKEQMWMADAPVTIVACGYPKLAYPHMGGRHSSLDIDIAIALDHLTLAVVAEGPRHLPDRGILRGTGQGDPGRPRRGTCGRHDPPGLPRIRQPNPFCHGGSA